MRIGAPAELGAHHFIPWLGRFQKKYLEVSFGLVFGIPSKLCELLLANKLDLALIDASEIYSRLYPISSKTLMHEEEVLVASPEHFDGREMSTYDKLREMRFVTHVEDAIEIKFWFKHHFGKAPADVKKELVVEDITAVKNAVIAGMGFGLVPTRLIRAELRKGVLREVKTGKAEYSNPIGLAQLFERKPTLEKCGNFFLFSLRISIQTILKWYKKTS